MTLDELMKRIEELYKMAFDLFNKADGDFDTSDTMDKKALHLGEMRALYKIISFINDKLL